jgi:hypothetical protein
MQPGFVVVDKDRRRDVHGIYQDQPLPDLALFQAFFHLGCNVDKGPPSRNVEPEFFSIALHFLLLFPNY